jgi:uncharacterized protein
MALDSDCVASAARDGVASAFRRKNSLSTAQRLALGAIRCYKVLISPMFAGSCRYLPSCSDYAAEAIHRFGVIRGSILAAARLARCHPLGGHGVDAVPADNRNS